MIMNSYLRKVLSQTPYHFFINESYDGIAIFDEKGFVKDVNEILCSMFDYSLKEIIGKRAYHFLAIKNKKAFWRNLVNCDSIKRNKYELQVMKGNGEILDVLLSVFPAYSQKNDQKYYLGIFTDISNYKKTEKVLKKREEEFFLISKQLMNLCNTIHNIIGSKKISDLYNVISSQFGGNVATISLTRSERRIADLVESGKTTKEIATLLFISERTVSNHRYNIRKKLVANKNS